MWNPLNRAIFDFSLADLKLIAEIQDMVLQIHEHVPQYDMPSMLYSSNLIWGTFTAIFH